MINCSHDRSVTKLPLAFYQFPPVEQYDARTGNLVNDPMEPVISGGVAIFKNGHEGDRGQSVMIRRIGYR